MSTGRESILLLDDLTLDGGCLREEIIQHLEGLRVADQCEIRIHGCDSCDLRAVVRLHVKDYEIIERSVSESGAQIFEILVGDGDVGSVKYQRLLVENDIAVI